MRAGFTMVLSNVEIWVHDTHDAQDRSEGFPRAPAVGPLLVREVKRPREHHKEGDPIHHDLRRSPPFVGRCHIVVGDALCNDVNEEG